MIYYKRTSVQPLRHHNRIGQWQRVDAPYRQWIQAYFRQPIRDQPVIVVAEDEEGGDITLQCMAETNDKISGVTTAGLRVEIVQCRQSLADETLSRYP
jgi:hypothetical protein